MKKSYGKITVGFGTTEQHEINIIDFVQAIFIDNRVISMSKLEDDSYVISVENPPSSGRSPQSNILLTEKSVIALMGIVSIYFMVKGIDVEKMVSESTLNKKVDFRFSDNLKKMAKNIKIK